MAEVTNKVTDAQTAKKEAETDAAEIKKDADPKQTYERFRAEVDAFESQVSDVNLRKEYRKELRAKLGEDTLTTIEISYMNDGERNKELKDKQGNITERTLNRKRNSDEASEVDVIVIGNLNNKFEIYAGSDKHDQKGDTAITTRDLEKAQKNQAVERENSVNRDKNKAAGYADVLLDPNRSAMFQEMASSNNWFSSQGVEISKEDMREFLEEVVPAYNKADKDYRYPPETIKKLQEIYSNWDSPQMKLMQNSDGELTVDAVAKGCGYESQAKYLEQYSQRDVQKPTEPVAPRDEVVKSNVAFTYGDTKREYRVNAAGHLLSYSETTGNTTSHFTVDAKGDVRDLSTGNIVKTKAGLDVNGGDFTYTTDKGQQTDKKTDATKPTETEVSVKYKDAERTFKLNADKKVTSFSEKIGQTTKTFTVNPETGEAVNTADANDKRKIAFNAETKDFSENEAKKELAEVPPAEKQPKTVTKKYGNVERTFEFNDEQKLVGYTQKEGNKTGVFKVDPNTGIVTDTANNESIGKAEYDKGVFRNNFTGKVTEDKPDADVKEPLKNAVFVENATQHPGQGYWQVAESMLQNGNKKETVPTAENVILMRALQSMHKKHGGDLRARPFVRSASDLDELKGEIKAYCVGRPAQFTKAAQELVTKLDQMANA